MAKKKKIAATKSTKKPVKNDYKSVRLKLKATPYEKVDDMKKASQDIRQKVWERLETARIFNEMSEKPEFNFIKKEFEEGLKCKYGNSPEHLVKVYSVGSGIEIDINQDLVNEISQSGSFVESLIRSAGDTFSKSYYKSKGILPNEFTIDDVISAIKKSQQ